jgi:hypothetical protein
MLVVSVLTVILCMISHNDGVYRCQRDSSNKTRGLIPRTKLLLDTEKLVYHWDRVVGWQHSNCVVHSDIHQSH